MAEINIEKMAQNVAEAALDSYEYQGKTIREWIQIIREADYVGKWIPVSKRLPEESDCCLCCDKDGYIAIGGILKWSKEWYFDDDEIDIEVIAWMPLPKPYKAESEDKE